MLLHIRTHLVIKGTVWILFFEADFPQVPYLMRILFSTLYIRDTQFNRQFFKGSFQDKKKHSSWIVKKKLRKNRTLTTHLKKQRLNKILPLNCSCEMILI